MPTFNRIQAVRLALLTKVFGEVQITGEDFSRPVILFTDLGSNQKEAIIHYDGRLEYL